MATAGKYQAGDNRERAAPGGHLSRQPSRWKRNLVIALLLAVGALLVWKWDDMREEALVGAAYGARVGCVCRYVSQQPLDTCQADLDVAGLGGAGGLVSLSEDAPTKTIRAGVPLLAHQSATFSEKAGCQLEPWEN